jgi:hypothetical protein
MFFSLEVVRFGEEEALAAATATVHDHEFFFVAG